MLNTGTHRQNNPLKCYFRIHRFSDMYTSPVAELFCIRTGRWEVPCSILVQVCRPTLSELYVVFLRNARKHGLGSLRQIPKVDTLPIGLVPREALKNPQQQQQTCTSSKFPIRKLDPKTIPFHHK